MRQSLVRSVATALLTLAAALGHAQAGDWGDLAIVSGTLGNQSHRVCVGAPDAGRPADFGCPTYSMYVTSGGLVGINTSNPNANLDVYGTISATNFVGDGSGLSGVVAGATDRIVSGTNAATRMVAISSTGYISITQAGANSGWFSPYTGLVTLGVSATGPISGTNGYFSGPVGIGTFPTTNMLTVNGASAFYPLGMTAAASLILQGDTYQGIPDVIRFRQGTAAGGGIAFTFFDEPYPPLFLKRNTPSKVSVGIGTATPTATLDVRGTVSASDAVQVGSSSLACSAGIAGALRYASGNIQFCNGVSWGNLVGAADAMGDRIVSGSTNAIAHQDRSLTISTAGSQRMVVGENGNVGIGTSAPAAALHISGSGYPLLRLERIGSHPALELSNGTSTTGIYFRTTGVSRFGINVPGAGDAFVIETPSGNVGISKTLPLAKLDVAGTISASDAIQVGTSTLTCGAGIPGAIRYSGSALQYCNGTSWTTLGTSAGVTGTGSATAVAFWGSANGLTYSDGFYWNDVSKRLGIGTNLPDWPLHISTTFPIVKLDRAASGASNGGLFWSENGSDRWKVVSYNGSFAQNDLRNAIAFLQAADRNGNPLNLYRLTINDSGNVGINTASQTATLQVSGSFIVSSTDTGISPSLYVSTSGRVGIRTMNPQGHLHIATDDATSSLYLSRAGDLTSAISFESSLGNSLVAGGGSAGNLRFFSAGAQRMVLSAAGNVGIGAALLPAVSLSVVGEVQVSNSGVACSATARGAIRYTQSGGVLSYCNGTIWTTLGAAGGGQEDRIVSGTTNAIVWQDRSLTITTGGTQQMIVGENGRVGIGTDMPLAKVHIINDGNGAVWVTSANGANYSTLNFGVNTTIGLTWFNSTGVGTGAINPIGFGLGGSERFRISSASISTTVPLIVSGTISASDAIQVGTSTLACGAGVPGAIRYNGGLLQYCNGTAWTTLGTSASVTGTGSATAVAFWSGPSAVTYSDGFYWDNTNKRLGVGTNVPSQSIHVVGQLRIDRDRNQLALHNASGVPMASIEGIVDASTGGAMIFNPKNAAGSFTERARIDSAGNFGVGTQSPTATLQVSGTFTVSTSAQNAASPSFYIDGNGRVGVGTNAPGTVFSVESAIDHSGSTANTSSYPFRVGQTGSGSVLMGRYGGQPAIQGAGSGTSYRLLLNPGNGNVGISKTVPLAKLDVNGTISASDAIQLGQNTIACGTQVSGSIRYNTVSNTVQFCNGTAWTSLASGTTGASALSVLSDVELTNLAGRDYLRYDKATSKWVNISESVVMGTTTMTAGWPDALRCNYAAGDDMVFYYYYGATGGSEVIYMAVVGSTYVIRFNQDKTYKTNTGLHNGGSYNCVGKSISNLYADGQAYNFIGNVNIGSGALGDRITSGTLAMVANSATSYISLSTAGTTWGYLGSAGSFLPAVTANKVSSTAVSASIIQVGNTGASCTSGISGSIRYSQVSSTMEYCQGTAWMSVGPSATLPYSFGAFKTGSAQTIATGASVKVVFDNESFDTGNIYNNGTSTFTAPVSGRYLIAASLRWNANAAGDVVYTVLNRNGVSINLQSTRAASTSGVNVPLTAIVDASAGDTFEVYAFHSAAGNATIANNAGYTYFNASILGPQSGGSGGASALSGLSDVNTSGAATGSILSYNGSSWVVSSSAAAGVSAMASLTDVTLTNLAGRDYLRYDAGTSRWVNISESTVMSTTTIEPGWPDAIRCSGASGSMRLRNVVSDQSNGKVFYRYGDAATHQVVFNPDGSADTTAGTYVADCASKSISQLYAEGKAFNFIGNAATSGGGALGDRITSGTLPYVMTLNSATGIVSLSSAATTWGYLGSVASYLPTFRSTNISASSAIQVGSNSLTCSSGISGTLRYSTVSSTMEYCNSTAWVSMGPSYTSPVFSAEKRTGNQSISQNTVTKITFDTELVDNNNNFASSRFTVSVPGTYIFTAATRYDANAVGDTVITAIYKNGALFKGITLDASEAGGFSVPVTAIDSAAAGDYYEVYVSQLNQSSMNVDSSTGYTYFAGSMVGGGGGGSGGGSDNLGDHIATQNLAMGAYSIIGAGQVSMTNVSTTALDVYGDVRVTGVVTDASDQRLKTDIKPLPEALSKILQLNAVSFRMKDGKDQTELGFIAQEVRKLFPQLVFSDGPDGYLRMNYSGLLAPIVKSMQELNARFDLLQGINDNLRRWNVEQNMKIDAVTKANNELEALVAKKVVELNAYRAKTQELGKAIDELRHELRELKQANKK